MWYKVIYYGESEICNRGQICSGSIRKATNRGDTKGHMEYSGMGQDVWDAIKHAIGERPALQLRSMSGNAELRWSQYLPRMLPRTPTPTPTKTGKKLGGKGYIPPNFGRARGGYEVCGVYTNDANKTHVLDVYRSPELAVITILPYKEPEKEIINEPRSEPTGPEPISANRDTPTSPDFATIAKTGDRMRGKKRAQAKRMGNIPKSKRKKRSKHW